MSAVRRGVEPLVLCVLALALWPLSAAAIECSRAKTAPEIAICTDATLRAFNDYLEDAYTKLRQSLSPEAFQELRREQIRWIRARDAKCNADLACMIAETQARTAALNGAARLAAENNRPTSTDSPPRQISPTAAAVPLSAQQVYQAAALSVVVILGFDRVRQGITQGSGVVIGRDTVATNCHVLKGGDAALILFQGGRYPASLREADKSIDYCVLRSPGLPAIPATLGSIDKVAPGQRVYTIGSPRGLELTIAEGLVSGVRQQTGMPLPMIQTSAPISPGSSGGGLFDEFGRVIGITTFLLRDSQNINFALPVELFRHLRHD